MTEAVALQPAVELVPGRLWVIGGTVSLDGGVTWAPADGTQQPLNAYLLREGGQSLLVDAGVKLHEDLVRAQLNSLLPPGSRLSIFLTRAEYDCFGALAAIASDYQVERIYTGGTQNPFDAFEEVTGFAQSWDGRLQLGRQAVGHTQTVDTSGGLEVITPALRVLATFWGYHTACRTLFTSDVFGHTSLPEPGAPRVITDATADPSTLESVREHLLARFFWLSQANTRAMVENLRSVFEEREIAIVAPSHGRVLKGERTVRRHYELLRDVLTGLGSK
jgi:flavorubredoxin